MKHEGNIRDFTFARNREIMDAYRKLIANQRQIDIGKVSAELADTPCSRYWVSEERVSIVISYIIKSRPELSGKYPVTREMLKDVPILKAMRPLKREQFEDLFIRYAEVCNEHPTLPMFERVILTVNSPAKKYYLRPRCCMRIIYNIKNGFYDQYKDRFSLDKVNEKNNGKRGKRNK